MEVTRPDPEWCHLASISLSNTTVYVFIWHSTDSILRSSRYRSLWWHYGRVDLLTKPCDSTPEKYLPTELFPPRSSVAPTAFSCCFYIKVHHWLDGRALLSSEWPLVSGSLWFVADFEVMCLAGSNQRFGTLFGHDHQSSIISWTNTSALTRATNSCYKQHDFIYST